MLNTELRAKVSLSFPEDRWDHLAQLREHELRQTAERGSGRTRLMRASGAMLIAAGGRLQRLAGVPAVEFERRQLGETG